MSVISAVIPSPISTAPDWHFIAQLTDLLGADHVLTKDEDTVFFSTDIFTQGVTAEAVIVPGTAEELAQAVGLCTRNGRAVIPRGGGFSYTQGYIPVQEHTVTVDMRRLNRIVEINAEDLYVRVECGCTWVELYDALKEKGYRTPYFGPLSGYRSTVGGALSQGSFFLGSTQYGTTADTVLALDVALADGTLLSTGSAGTHSPSPHFRNFGPDLTGLFMHDSGALGFKAVATLKLIPFPEHSRFASFSFLDQQAAVAALSDIARTGLAGECYLWDPFFGKMMGNSTTLSDQLKYVGGVAKASGNLVSGVGDALRVAMSGKTAFSGKFYLLHVTIDDLSEGGAEGKLKIAKTIAGKHGGKAVEPVAPMAMRGRPFNDFAPLAQQNAHMRNLPIHGIFAHSAMPGVIQALNQYWEDNKALMAEHGITCGVITFAVGAYAVTVEPLLYWTDERLAQINRVTDKANVEALAKIPDRPAAAKVVMTLRKGIVEIFTAHGASHCQIGKSYPYRQTRKPEPYHLLEQIKAAVDPLGLVNPGALGLNPPTA
jgi:FAD/FMN-containing dehydrogenase